MDDLIKLFVNDHGNFSRIVKFNVLVIFIFSLIVFTKSFGSLNSGVAVVILASFALIVCNLYLKMNYSESILQDKNKITYFKLQSLQEKVYNHVLSKIQRASIAGRGVPMKDQENLLKKNKLDALYIDSNLVIFFYSIIKLYDYNEDEFYMLLKGTNNILKIRKDIENFYNVEKQYTENINEMFEIAFQLKSNCLNNLQNIIYSVPKASIMYNYIDDSIVRYNSLINKNLDAIDGYIKRSIVENGVNNRTKFIYYKNTKAYDRLSNQNIIPNKSRNVRSELHQLYP